MLATFVIFLREGVEASMIVSILLAYLAKLGARRHFRDVYAGVAAALLLVLAGGVAAYLLLTSYAGSRTQTIFETATYLLAATVLTYMTFWMRNHARGLSSELRSRAGAALDGRARWGLGLLAFQAVGREGLETMVFTLALVFASTHAGGGRGGVLAGGAAGLVASLALAVAIYRLGARIDMGRFFRVVGSLLIAFAAGILADAVEDLQQLHWLPAAGHPLWSTAGVLSEDSALGDVLHTFLGYADRPTALQVGVWAAYLAVAVTAYLAWRPRARRPPAPGGPTPTPSPPAAPSQGQALA